MGVKLGVSRQERNMRVFQNRVLRKVFTPNRAEITGENSITKLFVICTLLGIL
jgi:hypothetical protein